METMTRIVVLALAFAVIAGGLISGQIRVTATKQVVHFPHASEASLAGFNRKDGTFMPDLTKSGQPDGRSGDKASHWNAR